MKWSELRAKADSVIFNSIITIQMNHSDVERDNT